MRGQRFIFKSLEQLLAPTRAGSIHVLLGIWSRIRLKAAQPMASLENRWMKINRESVVVPVWNTMAKVGNTEPVCLGEKKGMGKKERERMQRQS